MESEQYFEYSKYPGVIFRVWNLSEGGIITLEVVSGTHPELNTSRLSTLFYGRISRVKPKTQTKMKRSIKIYTQIADTKPVQHYFNIVAGNGKIIATSETYHNRKDMMDTIELIKGQAVSAVLVSGK